MRTNMYCIYDQAAEAFIMPFFMHTDTMAIRAFAGNVNSNEEDNITKHPEQFCLFKVGTFDDKKGMFEPLDSPKALGLGNEYVLAKETTQLQESILDLLNVIRELRGKLK